MSLNTGMKLGPFEILSSLGVAHLPFAGAESRRANKCGRKGDMMMATGGDIA